MIFRHVIFPLFAVVLLAPINPAFTQANAVPPTPEILATEIDEIVSNAMGDLELVPGFALAIYTPSGTYARGFGVTDIETQDPVSADTAFYIASTTKAFTGLAMNTLHHRGEIDLDATLSSFAPDAGFPEAVSPDEVTLRSLLTHTHGLVNNPLSFRSAFTGQHSLDVDWALLNTDTVPNEEAPFGTFQYANVGYNILTTLTDRHLATPWQDLLAREIFEPAGMIRTSARMSDARNGSWSVAAPHQAGAFPTKEGFAKGVRRLTVEKTDENMQSAGGMIMSANDAALWLELLIEDGQLDGQQIVPERVVQETRAQLAEVDSEGAGYTRDHYGLGWYIGEYRDNVIVSHGGGFAGYSTRISYMPDQKIGVASFANESTIGVQLPIIINNFIYDRLTGRKNARKTAERKIKKLTKRGKDRLSAAVHERERRAKRDWTLSQPFEAYAGTYVNEAWGTVEIAALDDGIAWSAGNLNGVAEPYPQEDAIRIELVPGNGTVAPFTLTDTGEVTGLRLSTYDTLSWFRNTNTSVTDNDGKITFSNGERDEIIGVYGFEEIGLNITITETDGTFFAQADGQNKEQIIPTAKDVFVHARIGATGRFVRGENGQIAILLWEQAGQSFTGNKLR